MCDPISLAAAGSAVSAGSSIFGFLGQNAAAKANEQAANLGYANAWNQGQQEAHQIDQQQSVNTVNAIIEQRSRQGQISASASAFGQGAESTAGEEVATNVQASRQIGVAAENAQNQRLQVSNQLQSADLARRSQIMQVQPESPLSLVLGIAQSGIQGANTFAGVGGRFFGNS